MEIDTAPITLAEMIDHTLLKADATAEQVDQCMRPDLPELGVLLRLLGHRAMQPED